MRRLLVAGLGPLLLAAASGVVLSASAGAAPEASVVAESLDAELFRVLLAAACILILAKLGGHVAMSAGLPAVLGELAVGIVVGNLSLVGFGWFASLSRDLVLEVLAEVGVVLLLFDVGLRSELRSLLRVGTSSLLVALLGVVLPFAFGVGVSLWFLPDTDPLVHVFIGASLCATSVGITARVLEDLGRSDGPEARVILGAAVIDDVLGLVVLAAVTGVIGARAEGEAYSPLSMGVTVAKALGFFGLAAAFGLVGSPRLFRIASRLRGRGLLLATALAICFGLAAAASLLGLAPIVGAFAAGLALDEAAYRDLRSEGDHRLETLLDPLTAFLVPFFFVLMGARVELAAFAQPGVLGFGIVLTLAAVAGKQVCGLGVLGGSANRLAVGLGMVPRGEVGLIFAAIGAKLVLDGRPVIDPATYTALVFMVFTTTLVTPAFLGRALARQPQPLAREEP